MCCMRCAFCTCCIFCLLHCLPHFVLLYYVFLWFKFDVVVIMLCIFCIRCIWCIFSPCLQFSYVLHVLLEDDLVVPANWKQRLLAAAPLLPPNWDVVRFNTWGGFDEADRVQSWKGPGELFRTSCVLGGPRDAYLNPALPRHYLGNHAVILTSQKAQHLLKVLQTTPIDVPVLV